MAESTYNIQQISDEIYRDLGATSTTTGEIGLWLRGNLGSLNTLLDTSFYIKDEDGNFSSNMSDEEKAIFKKLYEIYYYGKIIRDNLGTSAFTAVLEVMDDNGRVRLANKNEISKTYIELKSKASEELKDLVDGYSKNAGGTAFSVDGEDGNTTHTDDSIKIYTFS